MALEAPDGGGRVTDLMGCLGCPGEYQVGLRVCPWCGTRSPMAVEGEDEMPKVTTGGASNAWEAAEAVEGVAAEAPAEVDAEVDAAPVAEDAEAVTEPAQASNLAMVGESGPELVNPPTGNTLTAERATALVTQAPVEPESVAEESAAPAENAAEPEAAPAEEGAEPDDQESQP